MWILTVILILCPIAIFGKDICDSSPFRNCPNPLDRQFQDIHTVEDIKNVCPKFIDYIACLGNFDETCRAEAERKIFPQLGEFESVRDMVADICDEEALLHTVLMDNLQCIRDGMYNDDNNTCYALRDKVLRAYNTDLPLLEEIDYSEEGEKLREVDGCMLHLFDFACYVEYVMKTCGSLAKDAVIEVLHRSYFLGKFCSEETAVILSDDVEILEISRSLKDAFKGLIHPLLKSEK